MFGVINLSVFKLRSGVKFLSINLGRDGRAKCKTGKTKGSFGGVGLWLFMGTEQHLGEIIFFGGIEKGGGTFWGQTLSDLPRLDLESWGRISSSLFPMGSSSGKLATNTDLIFCFVVYSLLLGFSCIGGVMGSVCWISSLCSA